MMSRETANPLIPEAPSPLTGEVVRDAAGAVFLSVAICTFNRAQMLGNAARSVLEQLPRDGELLIVDNASSDETPAVSQKLAEGDDRVRIVREHRPGISHARNTALHEARGTYIVFFDDDEVLEEGCLDAYIQFFRKPPSGKIGSVGGPYIPEFEIPPPTWLSPTYGGFDLGGECRALGGVVGPAGGNCAYPRHIAIAVGGFAAELIRCEDSELNCRLRAAGYQVWWLPQARIRHRISPSLFSMRKQLRTSYIEGRSVTVFRLRTSSQTSQRFLFILTRLPYPIVALLQGLGGVAMLAAGAKRAGFRALGLACRNVGIFTELIRRLG
jgi:glycosyltransferase involved in cell wall biosynthesis